MSVTSRHSSGMLVSAGATETWGRRPGMSVVKTTPSGLSPSKALQASTMREPPRNRSGPAVRPG